MKHNAKFSHDGRGRFAVIDARTHQVLNIIVAPSQAWCDEHLKTGTDENGKPRAQYCVDVGHQPDIGWKFDKAAGRFIEPPPPPAEPAE